MTQKHKYSLITIKYPINFALTIKTSLTVENRTQHTNHDMDNALKNKNYLKKSQYFSLD